MSSNNIAIRVEGLCKRYEIYTHPRDRLKQFMLPRLQRLTGRESKQYFREFWALQDVSFEVKRGETVGIVGRNGAGKSTLLQTLCGTLTPTQGRVEINGRVAALLELGSGFNPEFTGRENVYLNASVLGLSNEQIDARFNDIVSFADIGDFIDQPVQSYSSGMYIRLAFAVVVHVDADILIVDEALSVGDIFFQSKCMEHMKRLMNSGVTVLFVSHDIGAVKALCDRAVYLDHGKVILSGTTDVVAEAYYGKKVTATQATVDIERQDFSAAEFNKSLFSAEEYAEHLRFAAKAGFHRIQNGLAELLNVQFLDLAGQTLDVINFDDSAILRVTLKVNTALPLLGLAYHIRDKNGTDVVYSDTGIENNHLTNLNDGEIVVFDWSFKIQLREGDYTFAVMLSIPVDLSIGKVEVCDFVPLAATFHVSRGRMLPIYGYVHWPNNTSYRKFITAN